MKAELSKSKNPYAETFAEFAEARAGETPSWLAGKRAAGFAEFEKLGFPTVRDEEWKYTNVARVAEQVFTAADLAGLDLALAGKSIPFYAESEGARLVFLNGVFVPELSDTSKLNGGIEVSRLSDAITSNGDLVARHLGSLAKVEGRAFTAFNDAFLTDGAFIRVKRGQAIEQSVNLFFVTGPQSDHRSTFPRTLVVAEEASIATVVENFIELCDERGRFGNRTYLTDAVAEFIVEPGANLSHYKVQHEGAKAFHIADTHVSLNRTSVFTSLSIALGGQVSRHQVSVAFGGEGGECRLAGLYLTADAQVADTHISIDHAVPRCESEVTFRGVLDGKSRGVFDGKVLVRKDAQLTNSVTSNKNLLLSNDARVDTKPQLEIFADDVKCGHGATVGQLENDEIFYLLSRGLTPEQARTLLTYGFAREITDGIKVASIKSHLDDVIGARMAKRNTKAQGHDGTKG